MGGVVSGLRLKKNRAINSKAIAPQPKYCAVACLCESGDDLTTKPAMAMPMATTKRIQ